MRVIEKVIQSNLEPTRQDVVWVDTSDPSAPIVKIYLNGKWEVASHSGGGDGSVTVKSLTKEEYDALEEKDPETLYVVKNDPTNGHEWVDIGMVDDDGYHVVWATKNIGAETEYDAGKYFAWADTVGYYADEGHEFSPENAPYFIEVTEKEGVLYSKYNYDDMLEELDPEDNAAHIMWGGLWTMPQYNNFIKIRDIGPAIEQIEDLNCVKLIFNNNKSIIFNFSGIINGRTILSKNTSCIQSATAGIIIYDDQSICGALSIETHRINPFDLKKYFGAQIRPIIKVKDLSELDPTYDIYLGEDKIVDNDKQDSNMTNILWADLVTLRDNSKLVPGMWYRITDYNTTTVKQETAAAGNQFDVVVLATDVNKLSEDARAIMHENIYDVTFSDGVTKKCYVYYNELDDVHFVDCETMLGCADIVENDFYVDEKNKTIITENYDSTCLSDKNIQYNYFQYCNLEAWEIKYCLDNDIDRFDWAANYIDSQYGKGILVESDDFVDRFVYIRYNEGDTNNMYAWAYANIDNNLLYKIGTVELNIDPEDILYTKSNNPKPGDIAYLGATKQDGYVRILQTSVGTGVIYHMKDEFNNSAPYDFKNILSNINASFLGPLETDYFIPLEWAETSLNVGAIDEIDTYYYLFSLINISRDQSDVRVKEDATVKVYNFADKNSITNNMIEPSFAKKLCLKEHNVFISQSFKDTVSNIHNNHICPGVYGCLFGPDNNNIFIKDNSRYIIFGSAISNITIASSCSYIDFYTDNQFINIGMGCNNIYVGGAGTRFRIEDICASIKIKSECENININNGCSNIEIGVQSECIKFGFNCKQIEIPNNTQFVNFEDNVNGVGFDSTDSDKFYSNITFLSGVHGATVGNLISRSYIAPYNWIYAMRTDDGLGNGCLADLLNT